MISLKEFKEREKKIIEKINKSTTREQTQRLKNELAEIQKAIVSWGTQENTVYKIY